MPSAVAAEIPQCVVATAVMAGSRVLAESWGGTNLLLTSTTLFSTCAFDETRGFFPLAVVRPRTVNFRQRV